MKVLVIPSWYPSKSGNYEGVFIREQVKALSAAGLDMAVLYGAYQYRHIFAQNRPSFQVEAGINTFRAKGFFLPKFHPSLIDCWAKKHFSLFEAYLKKFGPPELIHAHSYMAGAIAWQIAQHYGIPYVLTEHLFRFLTGDVRPRHQQLVSKVYDGATKLIAVSAALQEKMKAYTKTPIEVIPNLVDTQLFKASSNFKKAKPKQFISVGSLNASKGYDVLIAAFKKYKAQDQENTILKIIGAGKLKTQLEQQIQALDLKASVFLLGSQSQEKIIQALQEASCFISSSRVETFGVAIIEALALGLPVIATQCGGPEEIIDSTLGQLVPTNDALALAKAMLEMKPEDYDAVRIRNAVEARFSQKVIANRLISFYQESF